MLLFRRNSLQSLESRQAHQPLSPCQVSKESKVQILMEEQVSSRGTMCGVDPRQPSPEHR